MSSVVDLRANLFCLLFYLRFVVATLLYSLVFAIPGIILILFRGLRVCRVLWWLLIKGYGMCVITAAGYPFIKIRFHDLAPEQNEAGVVVANHRSGADAFMFAFWPRRLVQIAGDWPFRLPFFGFIAKVAGYYNIQQMPFEKFMAGARRDIQENNLSVVGFPEGTRSGSRETGQFHGTLFRLANEVGSPVYPFLILGAEKVVDRCFKVRPGMIELYKMPAISPAEFADWTPFQLKNHVRKIMMARMEELEKTRE